MRLNDIFETWDKKRGKVGFRTDKAHLINNVNSLDEYTKELNILIARRSGLKITQNMLADALECSRYTIRNYETRRAQDNWIYIYAAKYIIDQYEWHLRQMEAHKIMVMACTPIRQ